MILLPWILEYTIKCVYSISLEDYACMAWFPWYVDVVFTEALMKTGKYRKLLGLGLRCLSLLFVRPLMRGERERGIEPGGNERTSFYSLLMKNV